MENYSKNAHTTIVLRNKQIIAIVLYELTLRIKINFFKKKC